MGTTTGLKPDSIYLDRDTGTFNRVGGLSDIETSLSVFPDYAAEAIADAQAQDYINSLLEEQMTPEQLEAQLLGLSVEQMNARTEDILDSILKSQGENETGFVNESARLAAEGVLKGKIAQAGVTDSAAQEAALKSAMEAIEGGASGVEAVKAAASGTKDYVEELLKTAKDIIDKGYDATIGKLPEILTPEAILADIISGNVTGVFEIGETGGALPGATSPIFGGTVGTVGGGTNVGIMTTGNAVLDAVIRAAEGGVDQQDIEKVIGAIISANTGIPADVVKAGIEGTKEAINAAKTVVGSSVTGKDDDDATNITLTGGTLTTRTCDDGSVVGANEACPEDVTTLIGGDGTGTGDSTLMGPFQKDPCDDLKYATLNPVECGGVSDREIIDDDLIAKTDPCSDLTYAAENPAECDPNYNPCDNPAYAAANQAECGGGEDPCDNPAYAAANQAECGKGGDPCDNPAYAAANQAECGKGGDPCDDPAYAAANQAECGVISGDPCDDPAYAAANQAECGKGGDPCDDPAYAASRPGECGVISGDPCDDPAYAAANQAECGVVFPSGGGGDRRDSGFGILNVKPGPLVDIDYLYDIGGPSIFAPTMEEEEKYNPLGMYSPYAEGGIVQDYDIEELIRFLENQRG